MDIQKQEKFSSYSHLVGAIAIVIGTGFLIYISRSSIVIMTTTIIYGASVAFLFTSSFLYHAFKESENEVTFWRRVDHIAIFFMIAGTYTPLCVIYLDGFMLWTILITQWALVFIGMLFKLVPMFLKAPRWINSGIYLIMGWMALIPVFYLKIITLSPLAVILSQVTILLTAGALSFTIGAVIYAIRKPNPRPGTFGSHDIFHVFVLLGAFLHYMTIFIAVIETI